MLDKNLYLAPVYFDDEEATDLDLDKEEPVTEDPEEEKSADDSEEDDWEEDIEE